MKHFGAKVSGNKVSFRVWAPKATQVDLAGAFNQWNANQNPLTQTGNGYWEGDFNICKPGDWYKYKIHKSNGKIQDRIDTAARDTENSLVDNSQNHGIITDTQYKWSNFLTPAFDDLILYQCHLASFCGRNDGLSCHNFAATFNDALCKLDYIRNLGFNAIALLPIQEYSFDRSWGYNPSFFFSIESAYGAPSDLRLFVDECHKRGLSVIFDVVYNHISNIDSSFWHFDDEDSSSYLTSGNTIWGLSPAFWEQGIKDFFFANMTMYFDEYNGDGIRFDSTETILNLKGLDNDGMNFLQYLTWMSKQYYPSKYIIAENLKVDDKIVDQAGFHATWYEPSYYNLLNALNGIDTINNLKSTLYINFRFGANFQHSWNLIKYLLGSHDKIGDAYNGGTEKRYYIEKFGGRDNWFARAKARMAWALNIAIQGTPMMFMGNECYMPGYWHTEQDSNGDHRFDWSVAGDYHGICMQKMVTAANNMRWNHPALRSGFIEVTHEDYDNSILGFKRWNNEGDIVLVIINAGEQNFNNHSYGLTTKQTGQWQQIFCSQDNEFGGWDGAGNAYYQPWTQNDGKIHINLPKWSVVMFKLI